MPTDKRNHEVPRCLIDQWRDESHPRKPVWVHDVKRSRSYQAASQAKTPYKFAVASNAYVANLRRRRATEVERWLSEAESILALLIRRLDKMPNEGRVEFASNEWHRLLYAVVGLAHRSSYRLRLWERALAADPNIRLQTGLFPSTSDDARRLTLEQAVNYIALRAQEYTPPEFQVTRRLPNDVLLSDAPAWDIGETGVFLPIGPRCVMRVIRSTSYPVLSLATGPSMTDFVEMFNEHAVQRVRRWVVATSSRQLRQFEDALLPEKVAKRAGKDNVRVGSTANIDKWLTFRD